jgi:predicted kinase
MELILLMGIQATGKSTFYRERFFRTHVRVNLDMLRSRRRENLLVDACLTGRTKFVVDDTNLSSEVRARFIAPAKSAGFKVIGYFFESKVPDSIRRNAARPAAERVPDIAIQCAINRLELPAIAEGFDKLSLVRHAGGKKFIVLSWKDR